MSTLPPTIDSARSAPLALGLSGWPARPPKFDPIQLAADTPLRIPVPARLVAASNGSSPNTKSCEVMLFDGRRVSAIEVLPAAIERPAQTAPTTTPAPAPQSGDVTHWIDRLGAAGVTANRHASPDLLSQLHTALRRPIDTIICTILDSDPTACVLNAISAARSSDLLSGMQLLGRALGAPRQWIALDRAAPSSWSAPLRESVRQTDLRIVELENDYPQADPALMVYSLTGRRLRPGRSPSELGVLVLDAAAAAAVGAVALRGEPLTHECLCVRDHDHLESYFLHCPIGASAAQVLAALSLPSLGNGSDSTAPPPARMLRGGDVLRDHRLGAAAAAVVGGGSELVLHVSSPARPVNPDPCIRCSWCFEACPTRIQPANLLEAAQRNDFQLADRAGLGSCIECGICTYVCPSRLPLLEGIRMLKRAAL